MQEDAGPSVSLFPHKIVYVCRVRSEASLLRMEEARGPWDCRNTSGPFPLSAVYTVYTANTAGHEAQHLTADQPSDWTLISW